MEWISAVVRLIATAVRARPLIAPRLGFAVVAALGLALGAASTAAAGRGKGKKKQCDYEVVSGDHLGRIANKVGLTQAELLAENPSLAKDPNKLRVGQTLDVCLETKGKSKSKSKSKAKSCGRGGHVVEHEISKGDTLGKIASRYGVAESAIVSRNKSLRDNPNLLVAGRSLSICTEERAGKQPKSKLCDMRTPIFEHTVVPGEHLGQIAGRYGVRRGDLVKWNHKLRSNANLLSVGQKIRVCPEIAPRQRAKLDYTVASGDSFGEIAKRYGLTRSELLRFQRGKLEDPSKLRVGQSLIVWVDGAVMPGFGGLNDDKGTLKGGIQLPNGRHYVVKWQAAAWGTAKSVRAIQTAIADYKRRMPGGPKVHVGDISKRRGGKFPPHVSHQHGRDVDVGYVLKGELAHEERFRAARKKNFDVARSWRLIKSFVDTGHVKYVFVDYKLQKMLYEYAESKGVSEDTLDELFQYPRGRGRTHGMIRHWKGHVNHFHVRFEK